MYKTFTGTRYTQADAIDRDQRADHFAASQEPTAHASLMHLHGLGYDVSQARVVLVEQDPYRPQRVRASFTVKSSTHPVDECPKCARYAEAAVSHAMVTGSTGATYGEEGREVHSVVVTRPHPLAF